MYLKNVKLEYTIEVRMDFGKDSLWISAIDYSKVEHKEKIGEKIEIVDV